MVTCFACRQEMKYAKGCVVTEVTFKGERFPLIPFGSDEAVSTSLERCRDCGARRGHHHHPGCCAQRCPKCLCPLSSCDCSFDGDEEDDGDVEEDDEVHG